ncbi:MAG: carboxypeptidase CpsA [archaeon]|nr:carboxypeptidase CpsA [archaeon]
MSHSEDLLKEIKQYEDEIIRIRRMIHENPELSYKEFQTAKLVAQKLRSLGIQVEPNVGGTGVVGLLKGSKNKKGKTVALRADMDALPVLENVDLPFKSKNSGLMHACGHDTHVAMLLGAAMLLSTHKDELSGSVKFLFQPAEEHGGVGGALPMIRDGAMKDVDYVFGLHIAADWPLGTFALRGGPLMAAPDGFKVKIVGRGGHGSHPSDTIDPIYVSSQVISAIQGITSRMIDQTKPLVISVCSIHSGTKDNIIPDEAFLEGTIRTLDEETRKKAKATFSKIVNYACKTYGAKCKIEFMENTYPVTVNNPKVTERVFKVLKSIKGTRTVECEPIMGGEDMSRFLQKAPGTFYFLGTKNAKKGCVAPNHSSKFKVDEDVLKYGSVSLAKLALDFGAS